jgi:hypothetical protein
MYRGRLISASGRGALVAEWMFRQDMNLYRCLDQATKWLKAIQKESIARQVWDIATVDDLNMVLRVCAVGTQQPNVLWAHNHRAWTREDIR